MIDLAKKIKKFLDSKSKIKKIKHPEAYPTDDPKRRAPDLSKAFKDLNYLNNCNTEKGIKKFCNWAINNY
jgi:UDP-glucuronate decarboxylase